MDTKDWAGMREVFVDDVVIDTRESGGDRIEGADTFMAFLQDALGEATNVRHEHQRPGLSRRSHRRPAGGAKRPRVTRRRERVGANGRASGRGRVRGYGVLSG